MGCGCNKSTKYEFEGKTKMITFRESERLSKLGKVSVAKRQVNKKAIECAK